MLMFGTAARIHLGVVPDPVSGETKADLAEAKQMIDLLDVLKIKTAGNLTAAESPCWTTSCSTSTWAIWRLSSEHDQTGSVDLRVAHPRVVPVGDRSPGQAGAFQMFPAAEVQEAHALRQRILAEVPQLETRQLHEPARLSQEAIAFVQQRLAALQAREAENPFFHWAQGELLRQTQGPAVGAPAFDRARQAAGQRALIHWLLWHDYLASDLRPEAEREERALQAIQLTWGLTRFPLLATEEMRLGAEAAESGDLTRALTLYDAALANTPESPEALIGRATLIWQANKARVFEVVRGLAAGVSQSLRGTGTGFRVTSNLLFSLLVTWLAALCLVAAILSIRIQPLFGHELSERILKALPPSSQVSRGLLLFFCPLMLGLGLCWAAILALLVSAPYLTGRERGAASLLLAVLVALPFGYEWVGTRHVLASSRQFALAQAVERGGRGETLVQELRRWAEEAPNAGLPRYYLGLVLKRRGELAQGKAEMVLAAQLLPREGFVQVGLGEPSVPSRAAVGGRGNLPSGRPEIVPASGAVQLNLSKLYTQRLQLDQSDEALTRSLKLDRTWRGWSLRSTGRASHSLSSMSRCPGMRWPQAWRRESRRCAPWPKACGAAPLRGVSLTLLPYIATVLFILFWTHVRLRGRTPPVRRCLQCGTPFCGTCQTNAKEKEYCSPCAAVLRQREGVTAFVRGRRLREGEEWLRRERARVGILGSVVPGGSDLYGGRLLRGLLLCLPALWLLAEGFLLDRLTPSLRFVSPLPSPIRYSVAFLLLLALYLYSVHRSWARPIAKVR